MPLTRKSSSKRDIESHAVVFYAEDGTYLKPELATPHKRRLFGLVTVEGEYDLVRCDPAPPEIDPIEVALSEATGIKPNNFHFVSVDAVRAHVAKCRESATRSYFFVTAAFLIDSTTSLPASSIAFSSAASNDGPPCAAALAAAPAITLCMTKFAAPAVRSTVPP